MRQKKKKKTKKWKFKCSSLNVFYVYCLVALAGQVLFKKRFQMISKPT